MSRRRALLFDNGVLPSGYTQVKSILTNGESVFRIETGLGDLTSRMRFTMDCRILKAGVSNYTLGYRKSSGSTVLFGVTGSTSNRLINATVNGIVKTSSALTRIAGHEYTYDGSIRGTVNFNLTVTDNTTGASETITASATAWPSIPSLFVGGLNNSNIHEGLAIYGFELHDRTSASSLTDDTVFRGIPCLNSAGVAGMYDTVSNTFFRSNTTTDFGWEEL